MSITHGNITGFFEEVLNNLECMPTTKAYIISIFSKFKNSTYDLSKNNLTLQFARAREQYDFLTYQNIADWVFFTLSWAPEHLRFASQDYYTTLAQMSYYACYKIVGRQLFFYCELADNFVPLTEQTKQSLDALIT